MKIEKLIGKSFKRNKYGLSIWTDTIKDVYVSFKVRNIDGFKIPEVRVLGSENVYDISEIVVEMPLNIVDKTTLQNKSVLEFISLNLKELKNARIKDNKKS